MDPVVGVLWGELLVRRAVGRIVPAWRVAMRDPDLGGTVHSLRHRTPERTGRPSRRGETRTDMTDETTSTPEPERVHEVTAEINLSLATGQPIPEPDPEPEEPITESTATHSREKRDE
jgi:hypothetical protein